MNTFKVTITPTDFKFKSFLFFLSNAMGISCPSIEKNVFLLDVSSIDQSTKNLNFIDSIELFDQFKEENEISFFRFHLIVIFIVKSSTERCERRNSFSKMLSQCDTNVC